MYDIEAEISESELFKILFRHKFTTTQNGVSSLEIKYKKSIFKINSELNLPKQHILSIYWPEKTLTIESKVDTKSLMPFNTVISHDIKLDKTQHVATIVNTIKYDNMKKKFSFKSVGEKSNKVIYTVGFGGQLNHNFSSNKLLYDFETNLDLIVPGRDIDIVLESKQFSNFQMLDPLDKREKKIFHSQFTHRNNKNGKVYGYQTLIEIGKAPESVYKIEKSIYRGSSSDKCTFRIGGTGDKRFFGLSIDSKKTFNYEFMLKWMKETGKMSASILTSLDFKESDKFDFFYKNNIVFKNKLAGSYELSWNGEYGMGKTSPKSPTTGSLSLHYRPAERVMINFDLSNPLLWKLNLEKVAFGFNLETTKQEKIKYVITSSTIVKWQERRERTSKFYELKINGNCDFSQNIIDLKGELVKDSSTNKLVDLVVKLKKLEYGKFESEFKFKKLDKFGSLTFNVNAKEFRDHNILFSIQSSSAYLKEFSFSSDMKLNKNILHGNSRLTFDSNKLYKFEVTHIRKFDYSNGLDMVSNVKWVSNVPYLNSGSYVLGLLVYKSENLKLNYNLNYKNAKKLNIKFSADTKSKEVQILAESFIGNTLKFSLHGTMPTNEMITFKTEFGYKESFLKIQDTKLSWKNDDKKRSEEFTMTILSSNEDFTDIVLVSNSYYEIGKFFTTFKANDVIRYKGKPIHTVKFDLLAGEIKIHSMIGQYTKTWKLDTFTFDLKYHFNSIRDWSLKSAVLAQPAYKKSEFEIVYFRRGSGESSRKIEKFGEAALFGKILYLYDTNEFRQIIFFDKDLKQGNLIFKGKIPKIGLSEDEISADLTIKKLSDSVFEGMASFKDSKYKFKFESFGTWKKYFEANAITSGFVPKSLLISCDFQDHTIFKIAADKIFIADVNVQSQSSGMKSGSVGLTFRGNELMNLKVNSNNKWPKDVQTITDYLKAIFGIKKGVHLKVNFNGKFLDKVVKREAELYHLDSKQFPGGTKTFYRIDTTVTDSNKLIYNIMFAFDRKYPMIHFEDTIFVKVDNEVKIDIAEVIKYVSTEDFIVSSVSNVKSYLITEILVVFNKNVIQTNFLLHIPEKDLQYGFGFRKLFETKDFGAHLVYSKNNFTMETNIGSLADKGPNGEYFPVGKEYYIQFIKKYELSIRRRKPLEFDVRLNYNWEKPIQVTIEITKTDKVKVNIRGTTPFAQVKQFTYKIEFETKQSKFEYASSLRVNKETLSELSLKYIAATADAPHHLKVDYKGPRHIKGFIKFSRERSEFSHSITAKDGTFKTELWTSDSKCQWKTIYDCSINHKNNARLVVVGMKLADNEKRFELSWNKNKDRSLILTLKKDGKQKTITLENPIKRITLSHFKEIGDNMRNGVFSVDIRSVDKSTDKDISVKVTYKMKGSLGSDYKLDMNLKTNLIHKVRCGDYWYIIFIMEPGNQIVRQARCQRGHWRFVRFRHQGVLRQ